MGSHVMVIRTPPFKLKGHLAERLGGALRATRPAGDRAADREVEALDEGRLDSTRKPERAQGLTKCLRCASTGVVFDGRELAALVTFHQLGVKQAGRDLPATTALISRLYPLAEMRRESVKL